MAPLQLFALLAPLLWPLLNLPAHRGSMVSADDSVSQCMWTDCITGGTQTCPGGNRAGACNPQCPSGYTPTSTSGGHGVCDSGGTRFFCCPENAAPECSTVKANAVINSICVGRCSADQVKIGSDTSGCALGYNDICCSRSASLSAQESCSWNNTCSDISWCTGSQTNQIAYTPFGDSGAPCSGTQNKVLCCGNPNPYQNCVWYSGGPANGPCQGVCGKSTQTIVATDQHQCTSGNRVLCCDAPDLDIVQAQFELTLAAFAKNPSCPASETDDHTDAALKLPSNSPEINVKRKTALEDRDISYLGDYDAFGELIGYFNGTTNADRQLTQSWDRTVGQTNLYSWEYMSIINGSPEEDPAGLFVDHLCLWSDARTVWGNQNRTAHDLCQQPWPLAPGVPTKRDTKLSARAFTPDLSTTQPLTGGNSEINVGALVSRITNTNNQVPFLYSRLIPYAGNAAECILEVVYDLRNNHDLQQTVGQDIFAVFHFHVDHMADDPQGTGPAYPGVVLANVFHAQDVYDANENDITNLAEWRVDGSWQQATGSNRRAIPMQCTIAGNVWYPGDPQGNIEGFEQLWENFGALLRHQGVLSGPTFHNWVGGTNRNNQWRWNGNENGWPNQGAVPAGGNTCGAPADMRGNRHGGPWPEQ